MKMALVLVDVQNDFFPGGALPTPEGDEIIEPINQLIEQCGDMGMPVFATRDWHPENHCSFEEQGGPWPPHCIQETEGAAFHPEIELPEDVAIISKAESADREAYSAFQSAGLGERLRELGVTGLVVAGLATDVCVRQTVLDALDEGFAVTVIQEAVSGVEAEPGDSRRALEEMAEHGAQILSMEDLAAREAS